MLELAISGWLITLIFGLGFIVGFAVGIGRGMKWRPRKNPLLEGHKIIKCEKLRTNPIT